MKLGLIIKRAEQERVMRIGLTRMFVAASALLSCGPAFAEPHLFRTGTIPYFGGIHNYTDETHLGVGFTNVISWSFTYEAINDPSDATMNIFLGWNTRIFGYRRGNDMLQQLENRSGPDSYTKASTQKRIAFSGTAPALFDDCANVGPIGEICSITQVQVFVNGGGFGALNITRPIDYAMYTDGVTSVPEPETWVMMLLGFGGVGAAFRVRTHSSSITTSRRLSQRS